MTELMDAWIRKAGRELESVWHPVTEPPEPGEYLVAFRSGKLMTATWAVTEWEPDGEWLDDDEPIEDWTGQVVEYWRVRPEGPGR